MKSVISLIIFSLVSGWLTGRGDTALDSLKEILAQREDVNDSIACSVNEQIAMIYFKRHDLDGALPHFNSVIDYLEEKPGKKRLPEVLGNLGRLYYNVGKYSDALRYYLKALDVVEKTGERDFEMFLYNYAGSVFKRQNNLDKALEYYDKGLKASIRDSNQLGIADSYNRIGVIYHMRSDYDMAFDYYYKSLEIKQKMGYHNGVAESFGNLGILMETQERFEEAIDYYRKSIDIREKSGDRFGLAINYNNLGKLYVDIGQFHKGIELLNKSLNISTEMHATDLTKAIYLTLSEAYKASGDYKNALQMHELFTVYSDSLYNERSQKFIAEMEEKYEADQRRKEIELLNKEKRIQKLQLARDKAEFRRFGFMLLFMAIGLILTVLLIVLIWRLYTEKKKSSDALEEKNAILNQQNEEIIVQSEQIHHQKNILEHTHHEVTSSLVYAERIQEALLQSEVEDYPGLPERFILYLPKEIVSGDFYWSRLVGSYYYFAVVDCTGHGVPGAFMSMLGISFLNNIFAEVSNPQPGQILDILRDMVIRELKQKTRDGLQRDGMDIGLIRLNIQTNELLFSGAYNPMYLVRNNELTEFKGDRMPIGLKINNKREEFTQVQVQLEKGDKIYLMSDGFADQFGGDKGRKFTYGRLKELLVEMDDKEFSKQGIRLLNILYDWKGKYEQVDDVCLGGLKII